MEICESSLERSSNSGKGNAGGRAKGRCDKSAWLRSAQGDEALHILPGTCCVKIEVKAQGQQQIVCFMGNYSKQ